MELRHLRYFVAVAEQQHIRKASLQLRIAQPALSKQLHDLEDEIGFQLFDRLPRGIRLNDAGKVFLCEVRSILKSVDAAVISAQRASRGEIGLLRIGFIENASWFGAFPNTVQDFRANHPDVALRLSPMFSKDQVRAIAANELDGGFCYGFEDKGPELSHIRVRVDKVVLAVPRAYGWRKRKKLALHELKGEPFIFIDRRSAPLYIDQIMATAYKRGLVPRITQEVVDETTMLSLVSAGIGIAFANSANEGRKPEAVDFIQLTDFHLELPLHFAWRTDDLSPILTNFRLAVTRYCAD